jgi:hypothetical protein
MSHGWVNLQVSVEPSQSTISRCRRAFPSLFQH